MRYLTDKISYFERDSTGRYESVSGSLVFTADIDKTIKLLKGKSIEIFVIGRQNGTNDWQVGYFFPIEADSNGNRKSIILTLATGNGTWNQKK